MNERVYNNKIERLRFEERIERLQVENVVGHSLAGKQSSSLLDVGTGSGLFAEAFLKKGLRVAAVDINQEMLDAAKPFLPGCELKIAPAENLPFADKTFDIVFMGVVFHEVDDYKKTLEEAKRVAANYVVLLEWKYTVEDFGPPLEHRIKPEFLKTLSDEVGLENIETIPLKHLVLYKLAV